MSFMVEENARGGKATHHVFGPCRPITEHEDLARPFCPQVDQLVAGATQEAGEIKIARLECDLSRRAPRLSSWHYTFSSKKSLSASGEGLLTRHFTMKQAQPLKSDAHGGLSSLISSKIWVRSIACSPQLIITSAVGDRRMAQLQRFRSGNHGRQRRLAPPGENIDDDIGGIENRRWRQA
jgi:hypothetical protein